MGRETHAGDFFWQKWAFGVVYLKTQTKLPPQSMPSITSCGSVSRKCSNNETNCPWGKWSWQLGWEQWSTNYFCAGGDWNKRFISPSSDIVSQSLENCRGNSNFQRRRTHWCYTNYRPISVLPVLPKIAERQVHNALYSFLFENDLIFTLDNQDFVRSILLKLPWSRWLMICYSTWMMTVSEEWFW